jgi:deoxycytidylate deaminase
LLNSAHIILTLKRPEEVTYLRRVYGLGLNVISVFSPEEDRVAFLEHKQHIDRGQAKELVKDDENDSEKGGQRTSDAFSLADLFIDVGEQNGDRWQLEINRYLDLLFSHPFRTPSRDEQAMFMAYGASLRSAQLGRQVGAAVTNHEGDLIAIGCNEVPRPGGGQYWEGETGDRRDHILGYDSNTEERRRMFQRLVDVIPGASVDREQLEGGFKGITEFGRAVHAEMEAIASCARRGVPTKNANLYTTTFPCHNCARHIVGFGIKRVVYIEPYPKSKATSLHEDAITSSAVERTPESNSHVEFCPFVGISPRRYSEIFTVSPTYGREVKRKNDDTGQVLEWRRSDAELRLQMYPISYIEREELAVKRLGAQLEQRRLPFTDSNQKEGRGDGKSNGQ